MGFEGLLRLEQLVLESSDGSVFVLVVLPQLLYFLLQQVVRVPQ